MCFERDTRELIPRAGFGTDTERGLASLLTLYTVVAQHNHAPSPQNFAYITFSTSTVMVLCTPTKKARIYDWRNEGRTFDAIGLKLGLDASTVRRNYTQMCKTHNPYYKTPRSGRPRKLSPRDLRRAERALANEDARDGSEVHKLLFPNVSARTVRRNLSEVGLKGRVRRKKPLLTQTHKEKRAAWSKEYESWEVKDWKRVWFTDESKFNLHGSDGRQYCRRRPGEELLDQNVKKTVKHGGGSIMVWGCITPNGPGRLHRIHGKMNAIMYCNIIEESLLGTLKDQSLKPSDVIIQQDNDPKHTSGRAKAWFSAHGLDLLKWAPQSPDMNIIEHAWDEVDRQLRTRNPLPHNLEELWVALQEEWAALDIGTILNLYESMPRRTAILAEAGGSYTKY